MRVLLSIFLFCAALGMHAQDMTVEQVRDNWAQKTITDVKGGDLIELAKAFQRAFPTRAARRMLALSDKRVPGGNGETYGAVAKKNGYMAHADDVTEEEEHSEAIEMCVWKRDNGHRLFAVNFNSLDNDIHALCFYDYNPQTRQLKPEKALAEQITPKKSANYYISLPATGKKIHINEFVGETVYSYVYDWDGMKPVLEDLSIQK